MSISIYVLFLFSPKNSHHYLSRALWLLVHDDDSRTLSRTFGRFSDIIPPSFWLPWIPQLLSGLERIEALQCYGILSRLLEVYPQSVFFDIRAGFIEKAGLLLQQGRTRKEFRASVCQGDSESMRDSTLDDGSIDRLSDLPREDELLRGSSPMLSFPSSPSNLRAPISHILQAEELHHHLLVSAFSGTSGLLCLTLDVMADRITELCLPSRLEEVCRNMKLLLAFLIEVPISVAAQSESPATLSSTYGSQSSLLIETPMPRQLERFLIDKVLLKCIQLLEFSKDQHRHSHWNSLMEIEQKSLAVMWSEMSNDLGCGEDWKSVADQLTPNEVAVTIPTSAESFFTPISVEAGVAMLKKWSDRLDSLLDRCNPKYLDSLDLIFATDLDPSQMSQRMLNPSSSSFSSRPLLIPGSANQLLFMSPVFLSAKSPVISNSHLLGLELQRIRVSRGSGIPGSRTGRISQGGWTSNGRLTRLLFQGSNGISYGFTVEPCGALQLRSEQRTSYMLGIINGLLLSGKESHRRAINFAIPIEVSLHPSVRLTSCAETSTTLHAVWDAHSNLPDPDLPQLIYRRLLRDRIGKWLAIRHDKQEKLKGRKSAQTVTSGDIEMDLIPNEYSFNSSRTTPNLTLGSRCSGGLLTPNPVSTPISQSMLVTRDTHGKATRDTFNDLCLLVSEDILRCYIHNCFPDSEHLHLHTKRMTTDLAAWSFMCYALLATDISATRISMDISTSRLNITGLRPTLKLDTLMLLDNAERVPFRLTRNLISFIGPLGKTTLFPSVFHSILDCLAQSKNELTFRTLISLTLRDDLWSLNTYKSVGRQLPSDESRQREDFKQMDLGGKIELCLPNQQMQDESISDDSLQEGAEEKRRLALVPGCLSDLGLFNGIPQLLCTPDLQVILAQAELSWVGQASDNRQIKSVDDLMQCVLSTSIDDEPKMSHSSTLITGENILGAKSGKLTAATNFPRRERVRATVSSAKGNGGLTIGQIRDKAERNTRKIIDRLGHLYNVTQKVSLHSDRESIIIETN